jgi:hypothetical protein
MLKNFNEQAFLHELASVKWYQLDPPPVEDTWSFFFDIFSDINITSAVRSVG